MSLKLIAFKDSNQSILDSLEHKKSFNNEKEIYSELNLILNRLKNQGYFTSLIIKSKKERSIFKATIDLGNKTKYIVINLTEKQRILLKEKSRQRKINVTELRSYKNVISNKLLSKGIPFTEITFFNYKFRDSNLLVDLIIKKSNQRKIDKVIIKGYDRFPKSFIKNNFNIDKETIFSPGLIEQIENQIKELAFVKSSKKPEVLFKQDSTILYVNLEKQKNNSIDALINLSTDDSNSLQFNGIVDLTLNNILNNGEQFKFYWNRVGNNQSEFDIGLQLPYILNSKVSSKLNFNIYRQDSTFLNTSLDASFIYPVSRRINIGLTYQSTSSNQIDDNIPNKDIENFNRNLIGVNIQHLSKKRVFNNERVLSQSYGVGFGRRKTNQGISQFQVELEIISNIQISQRSIVNIKNSTELLFSENYLQNELFRIGGLNSIRSFNEQSIFTSKYNYTNFEYRYYTSRNNYLHTITDFAWVENISKNSQYLYSVGVGYLFKQKNSLINLIYVVGGDTNSRLNLETSRLGIKFLTIF